MTAFIFQKDMQLWGWHEASIFAPAPGDSQVWLIVPELGALVPKWACPQASRHSC